MTELLNLHETAPAPEPVDTVAAQGLTVQSMSPKRMAFKRFLSHRAAVVSLVVLAIFVLFVALSPITARYGVNQAVFKAEAGRPNTFLPPSDTAWFGTDDIGRDLYSRLIFGVRVSLVLGICTAIISVVVGTLIGAVAGLRGGLFDDIVMRVTDIFLAFPFLVALLVVRNMLGEISWVTSIIGERSSLRFIVILLSLFGWMGVARLVRGQVIALKEREFIEAARALGATNSRIILKHLLPNAAGQILVALTLSVVGAIVAESTLGFFGYGPQAGEGTTSLGILVGQSKSAVQSGYWWMVVFPCAALLIIAMCISFIGDGLRDAVDPKMQQEK